MYDARELSFEGRDAAAGPVRPEAVRALGNQADDAGTIYSGHGHNQRSDAAARVLGQRYGALDHRRLGREALVLSARRKASVLSGMPYYTGEQLEAHRRQRALPKVARSLALQHEAPVLRGDRAAVHGVGEMIDRPAGDRIALEDRP